MDYTKGFKNLYATNNRIGMLMADFSGMNKLEERFNKAMDRLLLQPNVAMGVQLTQSGAWSRESFDMFLAEVVRKEIGKQLGIIRGKAVKKAQAAGAGSASTAVLRRTYKKEFVGAVHILGNRGRISSKRRVVEEPKRDALELFRRMTFNALISNIDDHPRNHALIAKEREWSLSPAYDLTPAAVVAQEHRDLAMEIGDLGRYANAKNLLSQHTRFLLEEEEAKAIVSGMTDKVRTTWYDVARAQGVTEKDAETIRSAFVYKGFSF